jgi:ATP-dependent helicase/nuclease subunit A
LTRARERLFVYGVCPLGKREEYENKIDVLREDLSPYSIRGLASTLEIILVAGESGALYPEDTGKEEKDGSDSECTLPAADGETGEECDETLSRELVRRFTYEYPRRYMTELPEKMSVSLMSPTVLDGTDGERAIPERDPSRRLLPAFADGGKADESAKRGIATHYFMQFCDFDRLSKVGGAEELSRLVSSAYLSKADGDRVRLDEIDAFRASPLFEKIRGAKKIYRELRFNVRLPAEKFTTEDERAKALTGKEVLVQGVIDCIIECEDGSLCLYDYKTDRLTREERADPALAKARLKETHREQLELYALAVEKIFGTPPAEVALYSLHLGDTVSIK